MKVYTLKVVIEEGNDEWWEEFTKDDKTGTDEVLEVIRNLLLDSGWVNSTVTLEKYEDK